jgi:hypothetical protein
MAKEKVDAKNIEKRIVDLKIELLKNPTKRGSIKKEIARMLTMANAGNMESGIGNRKNENARTKLEEAKK